MMLSPFSRSRSARTANWRLLVMLPQGKSTQKEKFNVDDSELPAQGEKVRPACRFIRTLTSRTSQPLSRVSVPLLFDYRNPYPDYPYPYHSEIATLIPIITAYKRAMAAWRSAA